MKLYNPKNNPYVPHVKIENGMATDKKMFKVSRNSSPGPPLSNFHMPKLSANSNIRITTIAPHSLTTANSPKNSITQTKDSKWATLHAAKRHNDLSPRASAVKPRLNISLRPSMVSF